MKLYNKKQLIANFGYLSVLQLFVLVLPLVTYPYLIRVLGIVLYGKVIFAQTIIAYFSIVINYGFNISATKDVAENRDNKKMLSRILSAVIMTKFYIWCMLLLVLIILITFIPLFSSDKLLYFFAFGACFNELLFQQFFFQGIEKMRHITIINMISRFFCFVLVFVVITKESDYLYVPLLNTIGAVLGGIITFYVIIFKEGVAFHLPPFANVKKVFLESTPFFISRFSSVVVNRTNTMFIGAFIGYTEVSYYDLAQKILSVLLIPFDIINQVTYPYIARTRDLKFTKKIIFAILILAIVVYFLLLLFKLELVKLLAGNEMFAAIPLILILGINVIFTSLNYFFGNTSLVVAGYAKEFNKSVIISSLFYLFSLLGLYFYGIFDIYILAILSVSVELLCLCYRLYYIKLYHLF